MSSLFLDNPKELERRVERLVDHFKHADHLLRENSKVRSRSRTPIRLLWVLFEEAGRTARSMPDRELQMVRGAGSSMPKWRLTEAEAYAIELGRRLDPRFSTPYDRSKTIRLSDGEAVNRMVDVYDLLRFVRKEGWQRRRAVLMARTSGLTVEQCSRIWNRHLAYEGPRHRSLVVNDAIQRALSEILLGIQEHFYLRHTGRGFERLSEREIEKRKRRREYQEASDEA
ncbi:MAG: hypothetical protein WA975_17955 [Mesorhizobium sp.]